MEEIAAKLYFTPPKGVLGKLFSKVPSPDHIQTMCKMLGGYVGEVYRRQKGGEWAINDRFKAFGVNRGGTWIFPPAKIHKRLTNGDEDNIWVYFQVLLQQPEKKEST